MNEKEPKNKEKEITKSKYTGKFITTLFYDVLVIVAAISGFLLPFARCAKERYTAKNTYIDGKQLVFTGKAGVLLVKYIAFAILIPILVAAAAILPVILFSSSITAEPVADVPSWAAALISIALALLPIILAAYSNFRMKKWVAKHVHFAEQNE